MPRPTEPAGFTFFFYGTLCDADMRAAVIGRALAAEPAVLADYEAVPFALGPRASGRALGGAGEKDARLEPRGPSRYPILLFQRGCAAAGVLCGGVSVEEAARLGFYEHEGRDYAARELSVRDGAGAGRRAWVYLPTAALRRGPGRWDIAEWQRFAKRDFLARAARTMRALEPEQLAPYRDLWRGRSGSGRSAAGAAHSS